MLLVSSITLPILPFCSLQCKKKNCFHLYFHSFVSSLVASDLILRAAFIIFHFTLHSKSFLKCKQLRTV